MINQAQVQILPCAIIIMENKRKEKVLKELLKQVKENYTWSDEHKCFFNKCMVEMEQDDPRIFPNYIFDDMLPTTIDFIEKYFLAEVRKEVEKYRNKVIDRNYNHHHESNWERDGKCEVCDIMDEYDELLKKLGGEDDC